MIKRIFQDILAKNCCASLMMSYKTFEFSFCSADEVQLTQNDKCQWSYLSYRETTKFKGLFTRTVSVSVSVSVKVYHCANGNGLFDGHNGYRTHSAHQTVRLYGYNDKL